MVTKSKTSEVRTPAPVVVPEQTEGVLPLADIRPCPFNFRKQFPAEDIAALAQSIQAIGLKERLLVRPIGTRFKPEFKDGRWNGVDHFELADGERRYRALKLAGVENVPVVVRIMTDAEVRAVMIASREQSRDLLPSELAAGYAALVADGKTLEAIAGEVGESVGHVRSVLALAKLPANALKAVDEGKLPRRTAELIARVPGDKARAECAAYVLAGDRHGYEPGKKPRHWNDAEVMSYRAAGEFIAKNFQIELKTAAFNRKALDLVGGVGSCDECPKRAGNDPDAKAAGTRADVCLDPPCFQKKTEAHGKRVLAAAKDKGQQVLSAKAAEKVFSYGSHLAHDAGYVDLQERCHQDSKSRKYKDLLNGIEPEKVVVAVDPQGQTRELVKKDVAAKLLKAAGFGVATVRAGGSKAEQRFKAEEKKRRKEEEARKAAAVKACDIVAEKVGVLFADRVPIDRLEGYLRPLVIALIEAVWSDASRLVVKRRELGKGLPRDLLEAHAAKLDPPALMALAAELLAAKQALFGFGDGCDKKEDREFWKAFDIDPKKLVKEAQAEQQKPAATKAAKPAKVNPAKATEPAYVCEAGKKQLGGGKLGKAEKNGHRPGCGFETALADGFPDGLPRKLTAKSLASIEDFPPALAAALAVEKTTTDVGLSERANKEKGSHRDKIKAVLSRVLGTYEEEVERGTEAFMNHLYPGRKAKQLKAAAKTESKGSTGKVLYQQDMPPAGKCRVCGCVESDCTQCVERTGEPCHWVNDEKQDLCSACLPLLECDLGILFEGADGPWTAWKKKLANAGFRTVGHVFSIDPENPPKSVKAADAESLQRHAKDWLEWSTGQSDGGMFNGIPLVDAVGHGESVAKLREKIKASSIVAKFEKKPKEPVPARPFAIRGNANLYVETGGSYCFGHASFEATPLYHVDEFRKKFPGRPLVLAPDIPFDATDQQRDEFYFGVRVRVGKEELVVGPPSEEIHLTTGTPPPHLKAIHPPVTQPVGDLKLRDVPGFPSAIATKFENVSIRTLADLEPKVALYQSTMFAGRPMAEVVYQTIVRTTGSDSFNATAARDALMKHLQPGWTPRDEEPEETEESPPSKSTRKEKVKS